MGRVYGGYLLGNTQPPAISPISPSVVSLHLGATVTVSFGVSDADEDTFAVFASSTPSAHGVLTNASSTYTYSFTVSSDLFLSSAAIAPLVIVAVDSNGFASSSTTSFQIVHST